jgi:hypothetical protein
MKWPVNQWSVVSGQCSAFSDRADDAVVLEAPEELFGISRMLGCWLLND